MLTTINLDQVNAGDEQAKIHEAFRNDGVVLLNFNDNALQQVSQNTAQLKKKTTPQHVIDRFNMAVKTMVMERFGVKRGYSSTPTWLVYHRLGKMDSATIHHDTRKTVVDSSAVVVSVGPALAHQTNGNYVMPQRVVTKVDAVPQREPKTSNELRETLLKLFEAIDGSLMFHQATSINGIAFEDLQGRVKFYSKQTLSVDLLTQILSIYPACYSVQVVNNHYSISAPLLAKEASYRYNHFYDLLQETEFPLTSTIQLPLLNLNRKRSIDTAKYAGLKRQCLNVKTVKKEGSLLERIRAKEQQRQQVPPEVLSQQRYQQFIGAQLKQVSSVLLKMQAKSYSLEHVHRILGDSLPQRLSRTETNDAIKTLAAKVPEFCQLVAVGSVQAVRISSGWNASAISGRLVQ